MMVRTQNNFLDEIYKNFSSSNKMIEENLDKITKIIN